MPWLALIKLTSNKVMLARPAGILGGNRPFFLRALPILQFTFDFVKAGSYNILQRFVCL